VRANLTWKGCGRWLFLRSSHPLSVCNGFRVTSSAEIGFVGTRLPMRARRAPIFGRKRNCLASHSQRRAVSVRRIRVAGLAVDVRLR
jgi:hypothetical protein